MNATLFGDIFVYSLAAAGVVLMWVVATGRWQGGK